MTCSSLQLASASTRSRCRQFQLRAVCCRGSARTFNPKVAGSNPARPISAGAGVAVVALAGVAVVARAGVAVVARPGAMAEEPRLPQIAVRPVGLGHRGRVGVRQQPSVRLLLLRRRPVARCPRAIGPEVSSVVHSHVGGLKNRRACADQGAVVGDDEVGADPAPSFALWSAWNCFTRATPSRQFLARAPAL
jgi:hypothetical protein